MKMRARGTGSRSNRPLIALGSMAIPIILIACGGRAALDDSADGTCPKGYTCTPVCPAHETCSPPSGNGATGNGATAASDAGAPSASDGATPVTDAGHADGGAAPSLGAISVLGYRVVDAELSQALASIVMVSDSPSNALHIYDYATGNDRVVSLPLAPVAVSVDPTGTQAAVAFNAHTSWIDLTTGTIKATCDLTSDAFDIALSSKALAYVLPKTDQWVPLHTIDLTTCTESTSMTWANLRASGHIALHPSEKAVFVADDGLSQSGAERCDLTASPIACDDAMGPNDMGGHGLCGNLWISADGARIYSACGVTLRVPSDVTTSACTYGGSLENASSVRHLSEFSAVKRVAFVPGVPYSPEGSEPSHDDAVVRVHETDYLKFVAEYQLPPFPLTGTFTTTSHGRFVFGTPSMDVLYVIVQADPSSGALKDFAIATLKP